MDATQSERSHKPVEYHRFESEIEQTPENIRRLLEERDRRQTFAHDVRHYSRLSKKDAWKKEFQRRRCWEGWFLGDLISDVMPICGRHIEGLR